MPARSLVGLMRPNTVRLGLILALALAPLLAGGCGGDADPEPSAPID